MTMRQKPKSGTCFTEILATTMAALEENMQVVDQLEIELLAIRDGVSSSFAGPDRSEFRMEF